MANEGFPEDLIRAERERQRICQELDRIPLRPYTDSTGTEHRPNPDWTSEHQENEHRLRTRLREVAIEVSIHPHWESLDSEVVAARMRLKRLVREEEQRQTATQEG
ncbi:hypothetical protein [Streptomyces sp. NPDC005438]|uniref:hypothetical protein n=1 Tax=Streptomyces sp. NPDC005438 TaxID=3156880 RepID=UPI0033B2C637